MKRDSTKRSNHRGRDAVAHLTGAPEGIRIFATARVVSSTNTSSDSLALPVALNSSNCWSPRRAEPRHCRRAVHVVRPPGDADASSASSAKAYPSSATTSVFVIGGSAPPDLWESPRFVFAAHPGSSDQRGAVT